MSTSSLGGHTGTNLVGGAVNLKDDTFYFGGFTSTGNFKVYQYHAASNTVSLKGTIITDATSNANGDMAFDADGNLYIVRGSGMTTTVFSVTAANFEAATGGTITASQGSNYTTMNNVNGVAFDASGKAYLGSSGTIRSYNMPNWSGQQTVVSSGLSSTDLASCSSPATVTIEKYIEGARVNSSDQFTLQLHQGTELVNSQTTTGTASGIQDVRSGPTPTVRGVELTISEVAAGTTNLNNYASSFRCELDGEYRPDWSGDGTSTTITIPASGDAVLCRFHNSPLLADVTVHKSLLDYNGENPAPEQNWDVSVETMATTGSATQNPVATTQPTDSDGNATWQVNFGTYADRATIAVSETERAGYAFDHGECVVTHLSGLTTTVTLTGPAAQDLTDIAPGDDVLCEYFNRPLTGSVSWTKVDADDDNAPLAGTAWTITGPSHPGGVVVEDCTSDCTGMLDQDPAVGQFLLEGLEWGTYTVTESTTPPGYTGDVTFTFEVTAANAGTTIPMGPFENNRIFGSVAWTKVDGETDELLAGSQWRITGPAFLPGGQEFTDCTFGDCAGMVDQDPTPGRILLDGLPWGTYEVTETAAPAGYTGEAEFEFTIDAENTGTTILLDPVENDRILGSITWAKTDATDGTPLAGSTWRLEGPGVPADTIVTDCTDVTCLTDPYADQDGAPGAFELVDLPWGTYTLTEVDVPHGYTGTATFTVTIDAQTTSIDLGGVTNDRILGSVTWTKVATGGTNPLAGSQWELTGPEGTITIDDCVAETAAECAGPDQDPAAGVFRLEGLAWGEYTLVETQAPAGYHLVTTEFEFTIGPDTPGALVVDLGQIENDQREVPPLPLTGGFGRDHVYIAGAMGLLLALTVTVTRRYRNDRHTRSVA